MIGIAITKVLPPRAVTGLNKNENDRRSQKLLRGWFLVLWFEGLPFRRSQCLSSGGSVHPDRLPVGVRDREDIA